MANWSPANCAVVGATGGIGSAFVELLLERDSVESVHGFCRSGNLYRTHPKLQAGKLDYDHVESIEAAARSASEPGPLDLVIVATGLLHDGDEMQPEKTLRSLDALALARSYHINTIGPALTARHFLPHMQRDRKTVFAALSARIGSISDNRIGGWHAYRSAKVALNMMLKNFAIEQKRRWPQGVIIGLHPGTVDTGLSKPFQGNVPDGKLFTPEHAARQMLQVIDDVGPEQSGSVFAYDGSMIPA